MKSKAGKIIILVVCVALFVFLPKYLPKWGFNSTSISILNRIPFLFCGLVCGPFYGFLCGIISPVIYPLVNGSVLSASSGLYLDIIEYSVYGLAAGILFNIIFSGTLFTDLYLSLIGGILAGIAARKGGAALLHVGTFSFDGRIESDFKEGLVSIIITFIIVPLIAFIFCRKGRSKA